MSWNSLANEAAGKVEEEEDEEKEAQDNYNLTREKKKIALITLSGHEVDIVWVEVFQLLPCSLST